MCKGIIINQGTAQRSSGSPRDELISQIGGANQYDFLILSFCEKIQDDHKLREVFFGCDQQALVNRMRSLLDEVFSLSKSRCTDEDLRNEILLKNYSLLEMGVYANHFQSLQKHFEAALHESWIEDELFVQCKGRFEMLRGIIEEDDIDMKGSALAQRVVAVRILAARSA